MRHCPLLLLLLCVACSDATLPDGVGRLDVDIRLLDAPPDVTQGELVIYTSADGYEAGAGVIHSAMSGGPVDWEGSVLLEPGTYFFRPCFNFGCGEYLTAGGDPQPIQIEAGEVTRIDAVY